MKWIPRARAKIDRPAISLGLSSVFGDDHEMLERGLIIYDALFAWCGRGEAEAEAHGSPAPCGP